MKITAQGKINIVKIATKWCFLTSWQLIAINAFDLLSRALFFQVYVREDSASPHRGIGVDSKNGDV